MLCRHAMPSPHDPVLEQAERRFHGVPMKSPLV
jgi:hypothetical protein